MRIRDYIYDYETAAGTEPAAAGTGEQTGEQQTPPAGAENTETESGGPPQSIPYPRFKEVNDQLRPYKELEKSGYGTAELQRLVEWEQYYTADPEKAWLGLATGLDLPPEVKAAVEAHLNGSSTAPPATAQPTEGEEESTSQEPPEWAKPLIEDYAERKEGEHLAGAQQILDNILASWDEADKAEGITVPDDKREAYRAFQLSQIAGSARGTSTPEEILQKARGGTAIVRELTLSSAVRRPGEAGPRSVPAGDGAALPREPEEPPKTLDQAKVIAEQYFADHPDR